MNRTFLIYYKMTTKRIFIKRDHFFRVKKYLVKIEEYREL